MCKADDETDETNDTAAAAAANHRLADPWPAGVGAGGTLLGRAADGAGS